jgi:ssDNA-binding Zn-finger/Zn-ribbon topoisomerase 1
MDDNNKPYWRCEECGYENHIKDMPKDRVKFYERVDRLGAYYCPKCKSQAYMPSGY